MREKEVKAHREGALIGTRAVRQHMYCTHDCVVLLRAVALFTDAGASSPPPPPPIVAVPRLKSGATTGNLESLQGSLVNTVYKSEDRQRLTYP